MSHEGEGPRPNNGKDWWDKFDIVAKALAALAVTGIGLMGSFYLQHKQDTETKVQLYAELMSSRERADSDLRKEMFNSIIKAFLEPKPSGLEEQVLALEMLTYNFHDVMDLGPLFKHVEIAVVKDAQAERKALQTRLRRAAADVIDKQLAALSEVGEIRNNNVYFDDLDGNPAGITILGGEDGDLCLRDVYGRCEQMRRFRVDILKRDKQSKLLQVLLQATSASTPRDLDLYRTFWVGFSDFPLIDNLRLKDGNRVAVVLRRWADESAELSLAYFPSSRASLKDKVYYDEVVKELLPSAAP